MTTVDNIITEGPAERVTRSQDFTMLCQRTGDTGNPLKMAEPGFAYAKTALHSDKEAVVRC